MFLIKNIKKVNLIVKELREIKIMGKREIRVKEYQ